MKKTITIAMMVLFIASCNNKKKYKPTTEDNRTALRSDTTNVVRMTDTIVIFESTCRGCAYEQSTHFDVLDSLGIIKLQNIITTDNNPSDMDGGSISKQLILVPLKSGTTHIRVDKYWKEPADTTDNKPVSTFYTIDVRN